MLSKARNESNKNLLQNLHDKTENALKQKHEYLSLTAPDFFARENRKRIVEHNISNLKRKEFNKKSRILNKYFQTTQKLDR